MLYRTAEQTLSFWIRFEKRLSNEFKVRLHQLDSVLTPSESTFEQADVALARAVEDRKKATELLTQLEFLKLVSSQVHAQVRKAEVDSGVTAISHKIESLNSVIDVYRNSFSGRRSRIRAAQDIDYVTQRYNQLSTAGSSELANAERLRLKELKLPVMVVGEEEGLYFEKEANNLETIRDELLANLESKQATVMLSISFEEQAYQNVFESFSIRCSKDLEEEATADSLEQEQAYSAPLAAEQVDAPTQVEVEILPESHEKTKSLDVSDTAVADNLIVPHTNIQVPASLSSQEATLEVPTSAGLAAPASDFFGPVAPIDVLAARRTQSPIPLKDQA